MTSASVTPQVNFQEVNAGWGLYPVAYLPAASSLEMQLTSGQFDSSLFALANGSDFTSDATFKFPVTKIREVQSDKITLPTTANVDAGDVKINGMDRVTTTPASSGKYQVVTTAGTGGTYTTEVNFYDGDFADGAMVEITWMETKSNSLSLDVTNDKAAVGEALLVWPKHKWAA